MRSIFAMIAVLCVSIAAAEESVTELKFITIDVAPWASIDAKTGKATGVFPELTAGISKHTQFKIVSTLTPFARISRELESGQHDCTILVKLDENIVEHGALVSYHAIGVIARKGVQLKSYEELLPLTVSVLRGAPISPEFDQDTRIKKEYDTDYPIGIRKIAHGRLDAIAGAMPTIRFLAAQEGYSEHLGDQLLLENVPLLLQCSKKSPALKLLEQLNQAIEAMQKDGTLEDIKSRYYF